MLFQIFLYIEESIVFLKKESKKTYFFVVEDFFDGFKSNNSNLNQIIQKEVKVFAVNSILTKRSNIYKKMFNLLLS
jgi:hypothetical protein